MAQHRTAGFTLVELFVILILVVIVIGLLLPAMSGTRPGRLIIDIANVNEHGKGAQAYAAEHMGRLPHAGLAQSADAPMPAIPPERYSGPDGELVGPSNGIGFHTALSFENIWKFYAPAFGNYMYDASGPELLFAEMFTSPRGSRRTAHKHLLLESTRFESVEMYLENQDLFDVRQLGDARQFRMPWLPGEGSVHALAGNYRYSVVALVGDYPSVGQGVKRRFFESPSLWAGGESWKPWRQYVKVSDFAYPTDKVLFWDQDVEHSPGAFYTLPGARVAVNVVDGSTRQVTPDEIMPRTVSDVERARDQYGELISTVNEYRPFGNNARATRRQQEGGYHAAPAWFAMTTGGAKGRDLGIRSYIGNGSD
ncbi:MAG: hypothetical protein ACYTF7_10355 [Planctomycetota bacterium]|jgi:hypothetical protein